MRVRSSDKRLQCSIKWKEGSKVSTAARLMLEIKMERRLDVDETVDHIDGDPTNDTIDNLQMLSRSENSSKGPTEEIKRLVALENSKRMTGVKQDHNNGDSHPTSKLTNSQVLEIKEIQKNYLVGSGQDKELAVKYGVCRSTIKGIRLGYFRKLR